MMPTLDEYLADKPASCQLLDALMEMLACISLAKARFPEVRLPSAGGLPLPGPGYRRPGN